MSGFFEKIDARYEVDEIIEANKINILYVRNNIKSRCKCYDELHKDGESKCKVCGGSGLLSSLEKMEVFCNPLSMDDSIRISGQKHTDIGDVTILSQTFYLKHNEKPKTGDKILIVGYDKYGLPTEVKEVCYITIAREVRGINGRVEMNKVICRTSPQDLTKYQKRLSRIPNTEKVKLMKGAKYKWGN